MDLPVRPRTAERQWTSNRVIGKVAGTPKRAGPVSEPTIHPLSRYHKNLDLETASAFLTWRAVCCDVPVPFEAADSG